MEKIETYIYLIKLINSIYFHERNHWTVRAATQLRKLDRLRQIAIRDAVSLLAGMPACTNVKRLVNHDCEYRLRVGDYRVLFNWE